MDVVLGVGGHVEVHDIGDAHDVDAARQHVGRHEDVDLAVTEVRERVLPLVLAAVAVDGGAGDALPAQASAAGVGAMLRSGEDDDAVRTLGDEDLGEKCVLGLEGNGERELVDRLGDRALAGDLDADRVVDEVGDARDGGVVERRREEERLALTRHLGDDLAHARKEAHVEHAVRLVDDEHLDGPEMADALVDEVDEPARCRDEDVAAPCERGLLGLVARPSDDGHAVVVRTCGDGDRHVLDLLRELARGGDHEHERTAVTGGVPEMVGDGEEEGGSLAGAGLGGGEKVSALEHGRYRLGLDGRGLLVAEVAHDLEHRGREAEGGEALPRGLIDRIGCLSQRKSLR